MTSIRHQVNTLRDKLTRLEHEIINLNAQMDRQLTKASSPEIFNDATVNQILMNFLKNIFSQRMLDLATNDTQPILLQSQSEIIEKTKETIETIETIAIPKAATIKNINTKEYLLNLDPRITIFFNSLIEEKAKIACAFEPGFIKKIDGIIGYSAFDCVSGAKTYTIKCSFVRKIAAVNEFSYKTLLATLASYDLLNPKKRGDKLGNTKWDMSFNDSVIKLININSIFE